MLWTQSVQGCIPTRERGNDQTPREAIGRRSAEHLLTIMAGNKIAKPVVDMGFELQVRKST